MIRRVERKVEGNGPGTLIALRPLLGSVTPEIPKLRGVGGNLEPMVTNEEEVVRTLLQLTKVSFRMRLQRKMCPMISGGTRVNVFSDGSRAYLRWITSPAFSSIYPSNITGTESTLIFGPMLVGPTYEVQLMMCVEMDSLT